MPNTLTIVDNRTGTKYELPIQDNAIRAMDLRQIKTAPDDFGLMTYDPALDRKSTRLNSSHRTISYAVFCFRDHLHPHSFPTRRSSDLFYLPTSDFQLPTSTCPTH